MNQDYQNYKEITPSVVKSFDRITDKLQNNF